MSVVPLRRLVPLVALTCAVPPIRPGAEPAPGVVREIAAMQVARMAHTATTLRDGRVLIAGGFADERHAARGAELFDPVAARFTTLPRMHTPRHSHSATLLPDGRVLIAGGYGSGNTVLASTELFDPAANTFSVGATLASARAGHVAVALADGTVLVAGGVGPDWQFLASAERYEPAARRFTPTGAMRVARESHAAVRLGNGRVLIVGGHRGRRDDITIHDSAEEYDPGTGRFAAAGTMHVARHKHDAVVLRDGRVLVVGGSDARDDRGRYTSTELFDPVARRFVRGPALHELRYKHQGSSVLLPDGTVLLAGGATQAESFDPRVGAFAVVPGTTPLAGRFSAVALLHDGRVLITGGYGHDRGPQAAAWLYQR